MMCYASCPYSNMAARDCITVPACIQEFVKGRCQKLWVGRWKWSELLLARQYIWHNVSVAELKDRVDIAGKLPRSALARRRSWVEEGVRKAIWSSNKTLIRAIEDGVTATVVMPRDYGDKLVHVTVSQSMAGGQTTACLLPAHLYCLPAHHSLRASTSYIYQL